MSVQASKALAAVGADKLAFRRAWGLDAIGGSDEKPLFGIDLDEQGARLFDQYFIAASRRVTADPHTFRIMDHVEEIIGREGHIDYHLGTQRMLVWESGRRRAIMAEVPVPDDESIARYVREMNHWHSYLGYHSPPGVQPPKTPKLANWFFVVAATSEDDLTYLLALHEMSVE